MAIESSCHERRQTIPSNGEFAELWIAGDIRLAVASMVAPVHIDPSVEDVVTIPQVQSN